MIVRRTEHSDKASEVAVYFTANQLKDLNAALVETGVATQLSEVPLESQLTYGRYILDLIRTSEPMRRIVSLEDAMLLDSDELGDDVVSRFETPANPDLLDPNYHAVDISFYVLEDSRVPAIDTFLATPNTITGDRLEEAVNRARYIVSFCLSPPDLA